MKKYILTLTLLFAALSSFAFSANLDNFNIDKDLEKEINNIIIAAVSQEEKQYFAAQARNENPLLTLIKKEMRHTRKTLRRRPKLRSNVFTNKLVAKKNAQKKAYKQMINWGVPQQLFDYIDGNFYLAKVENPEVVCKYVDDIKVEVHFTYCGEKFTVVYNYNPEYKTGDPAPITHSIKA